MNATMWAGQDYGLWTPAEYMRYMHVQSVVAQAAGGKTYKRASEVPYASEFPPRASTDAEAYLVAAYQVAAAGMTSGRRALAATAAAYLSKAAALYALPGTSFFSNNVGAIFQEAASAIQTTLAQPSGTNGPTTGALLKGALTGERPAGASVLGWWVQKWVLRAAIGATGALALGGGALYLLHRRRRRAAVAAAVAPQQARNGRGKRVRMSLRTIRNGAKQSAGAAEYKKFHWGEPAQKATSWDDPALPPTMVECGRFYGMDVRLPNGKKVRYTVADGLRDGGHVAYDPRGKKRLYVLTKAKARGHTRKWYNEVGGPVKSLDAWAKAVGGKQQGGYPKVKGRLVGALDTIRYQTVKTGDGPTIYFHEHGEDSGRMPAVVVDRNGGLWYAGGNYGVIRPGIVD